MTAPGGRSGDAFIEFHARTDKVGPELERAIEQAARDADNTLDRVGATWGNTVSDSMSAEIGRHGDDFADSIEHSLSGKIVSLAGIRYRVDRRNFLHELDTGQFAGKIVDDIVDSLERAASPGGPFSKVGEGIADAVGAGFNVSGRSPLIAVLIPAFGAIAAAIAAALQAVNALVAVLAAVPALIGAITIQAGTLILAFQGVGTAIQGAFAAKNATELQEAIKGLTPSAQNFVRSLLPLRELFGQIQDIAQEGFFSAFGDTVTKIAAALGPIFTSSNFWTLSQSLGTLFAQIGSFFASPAFVRFVNEIIPATVRWLGDFGPKFVSNMTAITNMATASIPFLERLGQVVGNAFGTFTDWINEQVQSGEFTDWLDRMGTTLDKIVELFFQATEFVASFLDSLDKAGGNDIIDQFSDLFEELSTFFESEAGQAAMEGFVHLIQAMTFAFSGLIFILLGLLIAFESVLVFLEAVGQGFVDLISYLGEVLGPFFTETIPGFFKEMWSDIQEFFGLITEIARSTWQGLVDWIQSLWTGFTNWLSERVADVTGFFTGIPDKLEAIGAAIMQGLRDGLQWGWDNLIAPILSWITDRIPDWKGPMEKDLKLLQPSGRAVMQGFGEGMREGADQMRDMLAGFTGSLSGGGGTGQPVIVNVGFHGNQLPTMQEAYDLGRAAGQGVNDQMSEREAKLAVRVL